MSATTQNAAPAGPGLSLAALRQAGKQVAKEAGGTTVKAFFDANKATIASVLPKHMTPDRMVAIALRALRTTPKLMECSIESLFGAVITCAQLGLEPNDPRGHIYLIPFNGRRKVNGSFVTYTDVQVIIGYKGMLDLARRSGEVESLSARAVHQHDEFSVEYGAADTIIHKPKLDGDRGDIIGFYAVAKLKGGGVQFEFMTRAEVDKIRAGSQGYQAATRQGGSGKHPWVTNYDEMGRKTPLRRLFKWLPMSIEVARAVELDERGDDGRMQHMDKVLDGIDYAEVTDDEGDDGAGETPHDPATGEVRQVAHENQPQDQVAQGLAQAQAREAVAAPRAAREHPEAANTDSGTLFGSAE